MNRINEKLMNIKIKMKEKDRIEELLNRAKEQEKMMRVKKQQLEEALQKEQMDVEKLEGISLTNFIHGLLGDKEERLEKEKQEALAAKLKYDEAVEAVEQLAQEMKRLENQLYPYKNIQNEYEACIKEKERWLQDSIESVSEELDQIMDQQVQLKSNEKEIKEALTAGEELLRSLDQVSEHLNSAKNWGTWDMLGGGMLSTMAKHSQIDQARSQINHSQSLLRKFHRELQDVGSALNIDIEIGSFLGFADYFFDGFFVDWTVQSRIEEAQYKVRSTIGQVNELMRRLQGDLEQIDVEMIKLEKHRLDIIENA